jgi:hypothetical protein
MSRPSPADGAGGDGRIARQGDRWRFVLELMRFALKSECGMNPLWGR